MIKNLKVQITACIVLYFLVSASNCALFIKNPIYKNLEKGIPNIKYKDQTVIFQFTDNKNIELKTLTVKDFEKYELSFILGKNINLDKPISVYIHYRDKLNYCRLNIFLDNPAIHLYEKIDGKNKNLLYSKIKPYFFDKKNNIFNINVNKDSLNININSKNYYLKKINFKKGKAGFSAYGKKNEKVEIVMDVSSKQ